VPKILFTIQNTKRGFLVDSVKAINNRWPRRIHRLLVTADGLVGHFEALAQMSIAIKNASSFEQLSLFLKASGLP
jgi:hypothetical protein